MKDIKYLIIPDVHGRDFWKEPVKDVLDNYPNAKIIFLGDYHDPYRFEDVDKDNSVENLKEIIDIKKNNPNKVILLVGNHDSSYIGSVDNCRCRHDYDRDQIIRDLFWDNHSLFKISHKDNNILFSHAGICARWKKDYKQFWENVSDEELPDYLNAKFQSSFNPDDEGSAWFWYPMRAVGFVRGGDDYVGSIIWSDMSEHIQQPIGNYIQIFGHTQQEELPVHYKEAYLDENGDSCSNEFYNLDCRETFYLDSKNIVRYYKNDEDIPAKDSILNAWLW